MSTPKKSALLQRRANLARRCASQDEMVLRATRALVEAFRKRDELIGQLAVLDTQLNRLTDTQIQHFQESTSYEDSLR